MAAALRYALYVWLIVSAIALIVQLARRRQYRRNQANTEQAAAASTEVAAGAELETLSSEPAPAEVAQPATATEAVVVVDPLPATPDDRRAPTTPPGSIALLLDGIELPAGLEPIVADGIAPSDNFLCLHTTDAKPEDVGSGLSDELERLGYEVIGISEDEAVGQRGDDVISLHIDPNPSETAVAGIRRFPLAKVGDVVVEVWTGAGPKPSV